MADEEQQQPEEQQPEEQQPEEQPESQGESEDGQQAEDQTPEEQQQEEQSAPEEGGAEEASEDVTSGEGTSEPKAPAADKEKQPAGQEKQAGDQEKGKKPEVVPGAELDPIALEPDRPLSAEEQARAEAEAEERARRERELMGDVDEEDGPVAAKPTKLSGDARYSATGKRKSSVARVILTAGSGSIQVNKRTLEEYFPRSYLQTVAKQPLVQSGYEGNVDIRVNVHGGGISGQASAVRHGIARALCDVDPELRRELKHRGMLTRDARVKERRKAGLKKARKKPQFSKR
jgi:small subunit ribosomal protein S9